MGFKTLTIKDYTFKLDIWLNRNCDVVLNKAIPNMWDCLGILFGKEGVGKSTLGTQICLKLDPNFTVDNIVFTTEQFEQRIEECEPGSAILWDEAITGADTDMHASTISKSIISRLTQIRKKRLKILLCFPYLNKLNKYFVNRCLFSVYVYAKDFDDRGYGYFYSANETEFLYNLIKEKYRYNYKTGIKVAKASFPLKFTNSFCADEKAYDDKKEAGRKNKEENGKDVMWKNRFILSIKYVKEETDGTIKKLGKAVNMSPQQLTNISNA